MKYIFTDTEQQSQEWQIHSFVFRYLLYPTQGHMKTKVYPYKQQQMQGIDPGLYGMVIHTHTQKSKQFRVYQYVHLSVCVWKVGGNQKPY